MNERTTPAPDAVRAALAGSLAIARRSQLRTLLENVNAALDHYQRLTDAADGMADHLAELQRAAAKPQRIWSENQAHKYAAAYRAARAKVS